ncbi:hypothetical protein [Catenulispora subtropica]|uniref:hypothetical protein n=1 Tax=Catenulispora subtropica TaxID=450798 RepID=UPI0031D24FC9
MSSSGLIYAGIVGAWAVYLVPVWLRREEQLNEAREKARYAAAIRTLGRSERFEKKVLAEESLAATGTDGAPPRTGGRRPATSQTSSPAKPSARKPAATPVEARTATPAPPKTKPSPAAQARKTVTAHLPHHHEGRPADKPSAAATAARRRGVLLMRRRRVVAFLFTLATFGAVVSITLGLSYSWAMLAPATLFSGYIVYIRRDEKQRARERYRRRQSALAAQRRQDRQRQAPVAAPAIAEPERTVWRPQEAPQEYRRAANG